MMNTPQIQIFDGVGMSKRAVSSVLAYFGGAFSYHAVPKTKSREFHLGETNGHRHHIVLFLNATQVDLLNETLSPAVRNLMQVVAVVDKVHKAKYSHYATMITTGEVFDVIDEPLTKDKLVMILTRAQLAFEHAEEISQLRSELVQEKHNLRKLNEIGIALSSKTDVTELLDTIITISMEITHADGATLYTIEDKPDAPPTKKTEHYLANKQLRFKYTKGETLNNPFKEFTMPISTKSIAGYTAYAAKPLNIPDVYEIKPDSPFAFGGRAFDQSSGYRTKSMLVVPMINRDKETIGVLQLINKKDESVKLSTEELTHRHVISFDESDENLTYSFASQAAVALENRQLYDSIKILFEGFIRASVTAIEARDPTTSGHSERVALLTVGMAELVDKVDIDPFKDYRFSKQDIQEIRYASLLHDFGKIGVREPVLVKAKKLYEHELDMVQARYAILKKAVELKYTKQKVQYLLDKSRDEAMPDLNRLDAECRDRLMELDDFLNFILKVNEPTVMSGSDGFDKIKTLQSKLFEFSESETYPYLTGYEAERLAIQKGSLGEDERLEINSHVTHTYKFLSQIPWTRDLKNVPNIAYAHHEKLDGSGYPNNLAAESIPVQARMMTIADIFDALTANDRPYKKSLPVEKAIDILGYEVKGKKVDADLFKLFVEGKVYEPVIGKPA
jgi:HD-GYP domain-containing protein (c-di-GMP phosphodiesterase class II)